MSLEKNTLTGNTTMLVLRMLKEKDMYGYQIIDEILEKSESLFSLKTGTLYPLLHNLEKSGLVTSYEQDADNQRVRRYYSITDFGKAQLAIKQAEWELYSRAVKQVMAFTCTANA